MLIYTIKLDYKMLKCYNDEDGDVDTKPALDLPELTTKLTSSFLSIKPENHNCKGMSLLNKQLLK